MLVTHGSVVVITVQIIADISKKNQTKCLGERAKCGKKLCTECWDQEIPNTEPITQEPDTTPSESIESIESIEPIEPIEFTEPTEQKSSIPSMTDLQWLMSKALGYPGVAVSITFMEDAVTFNAYPYPTQEGPEGENK